MNSLFTTGQDQLNLALNQLTSTIKDKARFSPEEAAMVPSLSPPASVPVKAWDELVAPWDGAMVHRARLIQTGLKITALRRLRWADRVRLRSEAEAELEHAQALAAARLEHMQAQRDAYVERLEAAEARAESSRVWWRSPVLWVCVGAVITIGLVLVTGYGLSAAAD